MLQLKLQTSVGGQATANCILSTVFSSCAKVGRLTNFINIVKTSLQFFYVPIVPTVVN